MFSISNCVFPMAPVVSSKTVAERDCAPETRVTVLPPDIALAAESLRQNAQSALSQPKSVGPLRYT